ncbi:MAG: segregation/condensation protein A [Candidatus Hydrogenedentes bacterium]|nr:segregation/condensation protein A [Candidatus Hydrogenedentota bacterium]
MDKEALVVAAPDGTEAYQADFIVDEATDRVLRLHLDMFEGPLEVLLYLIKAQEIDIFDIPIAKITDQYLKFLDVMDELRLDIAGDYLIMAATLIQIKSKMLIPAEIDEDEEEFEEEDPRLELVEKLIAYRKYKDVAARLSEIESERLDWFTRNVKPDLGSVEEDDEEEYIEVSLYDLTQSFKGVIRFLHEGQAHEVEGEISSVDEKIELIQALLDMQNSVAWTDLFRMCKSRLELICAFLAILEMCRMEEISLHQHAAFGDIRLFKKAAESNAA